MDKLAERQRMLSLGGPRLADYALELEEQVRDLTRQLAESRANKPEPDECPYPLFPGKFLPHHRQYLGKIDAPGLDSLAPELSIIRCVACGHITLEEPLILASG